VSTSRPLEPFTDLAAYELPRAVRVVDGVPLTGNNNPDRRALRGAASVADVNV
jgi:hypothetical protein